MNYIRLIIENTVYGYDEESQSIYEVGHARGQPGTRFHERNSRTRGQERREEFHRRRTADRARTVR
ncbi:hypothetical protein DPMN_165735 [Dreissena polymorpha]|uniref:Uncharacterized protein n=1 Tax=Dreissena polymorpha TaxID=45954 RepID=A0A9D4IWQ0_DREPO|nr:hypothetical protein DPMN_165735 [Dreissena polymorpha]